MKITETRVREVADLANLKLTPEEIHRMAHDLDEILSHIDKLNEVNTDSVEPMSQVLYDAAETATLRADVEHAPLTNEQAMANAPISGSGYYKVPRVIER